MSYTQFETTNLKINCPFCKKDTLLMLYKNINIPYIGQLLITTIICNTCKFKVSDIWTIMDKGNYKQLHTIKISEDTINNLVCASAGATIIIPEIGAEIEIRNFDASHITTIEGILLEILEATRSLLEYAEDKTKAKNMIKLLEKEIEKPSGKLTLLLKDPSGHSVIVPAEYWRQRAERARKIQVGMARAIGEAIIKKWEKMMKY